MGHKLANGLAFNLSWVVIVGSHSAWVAWGVALLHVVLHLRLLGLGRGEWRFILALTLFGLLLDQLLFAGGVLVSPAGPAPLWMSALWPVFATTVLHVFAGFARRPWLAAAVGGLGGYASYRAGASLTEVTFGHFPAADIVLLALWALLFPALLVIAQQMSREAVEGDCASLR